MNKTMMIHRNRCLVPIKTRKRRQKTAPKLNGVKFSYPPGATAIEQVPRHPSIESMAPLRASST